MIKVCLQKKLNGSKGDFILDLHTEFQSKKIYGIFGKSGSGKSTFFKMLAGISTPDSGSIIHNNQILYDKNKKINISPWKRKIGFVFQNYALFPHLNVYKNLVFGLDKTMKNQVDAIISMLNLQNLCDKKPKNLSGGQSQKVALGRAILSNPDILLLDEPFSGLDKMTKMTLQMELKKILENFNFTTFLISHDITEVFLLTQEVLILENGKFTKRGKPSDIFLKKEKEIFGKILSIKEENEGLKAQIIIQDMIFSCILEKGCNLENNDFVAIQNHFFIDKIRKI